ncbi:MAG: hypothetical protein RLZZ126_660 [Pseudomonadota bacterium]|jgi:hypothetical protein
MPGTRLITLLRQPATASDITDADWNAILLQARRCQMLGQLAALLERHGQLSRVPGQVRRHFDLELLTARRRGESAAWELGLIQRTVPGLPLVVLKGGAYWTAGDVNGQGRIFSDLDLMVPRAQLGVVQNALIAVGYKPSRVDAYDTHYYHNWMHEIPPMEHVRRQTVVDLHHAINPPISRWYVPPAPLFEQSTELAGGLKVLAPIDRIIHCALHLIQEGESKKLLRDLWDLHLLGEQHAQADSEPVLQRARALGVERLVGTAVAAAQSVFGALPHGATEVAAAGWLKWVLVSAAVSRIRPSWQGNLAQWLLLAHSHWIKMPLRILVPHLTRKAWLALWPQAKIS